MGVPGTGKVGPDRTTGPGGNQGWERRGKYRGRCMSVHFGPRLLPWGGGGGSRKGGREGGTADNRSGPVPPPPTTQRHGPGRGSLRGQDWTTRPRVQRRQQQPVSHPSSRPPRASRASAEEPPSMPTHTSCPGPDPDPGDHLWVHALRS